MEVVKFAELLNQLGVKAEDTTKKIAELKADFDEAWKEYSEALQDYDNLEDSEEKEILKGEIEDFERDLIAADEDLVKKIKSWDKNKEVWAKGQAALAEKRAAKKNGGQNTQGVPSDAPDVKTTPLEVAAAGTATTASANVQPVGGIPVNSNFEGDGGVIKKKSNGGWWILAGIIGIVTLGAVVMKKE